MDLVDGQKVLLDLVKTRGVKIHTNLSTALQCTANILRNSSNNGMSTDDLIAEYLRFVKLPFYSGNKRKCLCVFVNLFLISGN